MPVHPLFFTHQIQNKAFRPFTIHLARWFMLSKTLGIYFYTPLDVLKSCWLLALVRAPPRARCRVEKFRSPSSETMNVLSDLHAVAFINCFCISLLIALARAPPRARCRAQKLRILSSGTINLFLFSLPNKADILMSTSFVLSLFKHNAPIGCPQQ